MPVTRLEKRRGSHPYRHHLPDRDHARGPHHPPVLLTGITGTVEVSCVCGPTTVAPATVLMVPAGEEISLTNNGRTAAVLLAALSGSTFAEALPRTVFDSGACAGHAHIPA